MLRFNHIIALACILYVHFLPIHSAPLAVTSGPTPNQSKLTVSETKSAAGSNTNRQRQNAQEQAGSQPESLVTTAPVISSVNPITEPQTISAFPLIPLPTLDGDLLGDENTSKLINQQYSELMSRRIRELMELMRSVFQRGVLRLRPTEYPQSYMISDQTDVNGSNQSDLGSSSSAVED